MPRQPRADPESRGRSQESLGLLPLPQRSRKPVNGGSATRQFACDMSLKQQRGNDRKFQRSECQTDFGSIILTLSERLNSLFKRAIATALEIYCKPAWSSPEGAAPDFGH